MFLTYQLVLCSSSPRRQDILQKSGYHFLLDSPKISEILDKNINIDVALQKVAGQKARASVYATRLDRPYLIVGSDTIVFFNNTVFGKPKNEQEAYETLKLLSGNTHEVKTAFSILNVSLNETVFHTETTKVTFKTLSDSVITNYIKTKEPIDKAGAYGFQDKGRSLVASILGEENNIIGFPLKAFQKILKEKNWQC
ncbi:MAG: septum formation protein Maf [Bdellovibrionaceae bacterium]|nr:septum formation protein Maf [Pseudobdellovibrionaceae bacterium]